MVPKALLPVLAIFRRELAGALRRKRAVGALVLVLLAAVLVVMPFLASTAETPWRSSGDDIFLFFCLVIYCAIALLVPVLAGGSIAAEKQQGSYELLATSLVPPWSLLAAKLLTAVGLPLLITIACLPVVGILFFFAGVEISTALLSFLLLLVFGLATSAMSLFCSARFSRVVPAIVASFVGMLVVSGLPVLLLAIFADEVLGMYMDEEMASPFIPLLGMARLCFNGSLFEYTLALAGQMVWLAILLPLALRALRRPMAPPRVNPNKPVDDQARLKARRRRFPYYLVDPLRRQPPIADGRNPVYAKEVSRARRPLLLRGLAAVFLLALVAASFTAVDAATAGLSGTAFSLTGALLWQGGLALIVAPLFGALSFTREREFENLDHLRGSLLSPAAVVWGKYLAALRVPLLVGAMVYLAALPGTIYFHNEPRVVLTYVMSCAAWFSCASLYTAVSLYTSIHVGRSLTSLPLAYIICCLLVFLPYIVILPLVLVDDLGSIRFVERLMSPCVPWVVPLDVAEVSRPPTGVGFWFGALTLYALATVLLLRGAVRKYRMLGR